MRYNTDKIRKDKTAACVMEATRPKEMTLIEAKAGPLGFTGLKEVYTSLPTDNNKRKLLFQDEKGHGVMIDPQDNKSYSIDCLLGKGGFAKVFQVSGPRDELKAVKIIPKKRVNGKASCQAKIQREVEIHKHMDHTNIVKFLNYFEDGEDMFMLLEYGGPMTLATVLKKRGRLLEPEMKYYLRQILNGVLYIHNQRILHRDLKPSNFFIDETMHLRIGDFGLSAYISSMHEARETVCGTPNYISPEVVNKCGHSYPADVWALGCVVYALVTGKPPFETSRLKDTYRLITKAEYKRPTGVTQPTVNVIKRCLQLSPEDRLTLHEIDVSKYLSPQTYPPQLPVGALCDQPDLSQYIIPPLAQLACGCRNAYTCDSILHKLCNEEERPKIDAEGGSPKLSAKRDARLISFLKNIRIAADAAESHRPQSSNPSSTKEKFAYVTKWVDYSHKYGMCFQLSNHVVGARYNDGQHMVTGSENGKAYLRDDCDSQSEPYIISLDTPPPNKNKTVQIAQYFMSYMDKSLINGGNSQSSLSSSSSFESLLMRRWLRTEHTMAMILSPSLYQVNFLKDHTKLVLAATPNDDIQLMLINGHRQASTYMLSEILYQGCSLDILERLRFAVTHLTDLFEVVSSCSSH